MKTYKEVARCRICNKKYTVEKDKPHYSRYYCPQHARKMRQAADKEE